jgi:NAD(P)-dependent dehydrogenase (short-subunit alcohol dehydrogenase family)
LVEDAHQIEAFVKHLEVMCGVSVRQAARCIRPPRPASIISNERSAEMGKRFAGRRVLVTGSSRGIGAGIAERMAAEGADVVLVARTLDKHEHLAGSLNETADRLKTYGGKVAIVVADLTDEKDRARIIPEGAAALGGHIEILVNNAAASIQKPLKGFSVKRRNIMFEVNANAPLDLALAAIPAMEAAGEGWIVNLSSASANLWPGPPAPISPTGPTITAYGASKAALNRITNGLAMELYGTGIRVNTVEPRSAVLSEGAAELVGHRLRPDQIEPIKAMVEGTLFLCDCPEDFTGQITVSLDNV